MARHRTHHDKIPLRVLEKRAARLVALVRRRHGKKQSKHHVPTKILARRAERLVSLVHHRGGHVKGL